MELRMENLVFCEFTEKSDFQGGQGHGKPIQRGEKGDLDSFNISGRGGTRQERRDGDFKGGSDTPMLTMKVKQFSNYHLLFY